MQVFNVLNAHNIVTSTNMLTFVEQSVAFLIKYGSD